MERQHVSSRALPAAVPEHNLSEKHELLQHINHWCYRMFQEHIWKRNVDCPLTCHVCFSEGNNIEQAKVP
jgi:hypothetical protein